MLTYHNKPELKEAAIAAAIWHRRLDKLQHGIYWSGERGCAIGCHANHIQMEKGDGEGWVDMWGDQHEIVSLGYGWPLWLCYMEDWLFESMEKTRSQTWPEEFCRAVPVGVELEPVYHKLQVAILGDVLPFASESTVEIVRHIQGLHKQAASGGQVSLAQWDAARQAATAAKDGGDIVVAVAWGAALSAARPSSTMVAQGASDTVRLMSRVVDGAADRVADLLLQLLKECEP